MRYRRRQRQPIATPRLIEVPEEVHRVATQMLQRIGRNMYEEPFEVASILRAYGVRVISALGEHATAALRRFAEHPDPRVRAAAADELRRHQDVEALDILSRMASNDSAPEVKEVALEAVRELQQIAEKIDAEQKRPRIEPRPEPEEAPSEEVPAERPEEEVPLVETGEEAATHAPPFDFEELIEVLETQPVPADSSEE